MQPYKRLFQAVVVLSILSILAITYTTILINNFKTPEATDNFFTQSNTYYYIAEVVKTRIRSNYPLSLRTNIIQLAAIETALNYIVSPNLISRLALPVLRLRQKIAQLPLSLANQNVVFTTTPYINSISSTLSSLNLPSALTDAAQKVAATIPQQIIIVDTKEHPNSILASIVQLRVFFEHIQTLLTISWIVFILCLVTILLINMRSIRRLVHGLLWISGAVGIVLLLLSLIFPFVTSISQNPDPVVGLLRNDMIQDMVNYYFSRTRIVGFVFIILAILLYLLYRFAPMDNWQLWIDTHTLPAQAKPTRATKRKTR